MANIPNKVHSAAHYYVWHKVGLTEEHQLLIIPGKGKFYTGKKRLVRDSLFKTKFGIKDKVPKHIVNDPELYSLYRAYANNQDYPEKADPLTPVIFRTGSRVTGLEDRFYPNLYPHLGVRVSAIYEI